MLEHCVLFVLLTGTTAVNFYIHFEQISDDDDDKRYGSCEWLLGVTGERESLCGILSISTSASYVHVHSDRHVADSVLPATDVVMLASRTWTDSR